MTSPLWILHIESSGPFCSIAISLDSSLAAYQVSEEGYSHAGSITVLIQQALRQAGIAITDLSGVCCCEGPGSYTGLRVGQSVSKAICLAQNIPLMSYSAFEIMTRKVRSEVTGYQLPLIKARINEVYYALYSESNALLEGPASMLLDSDHFKTLLKHYDPRLLVNVPMDLLDAYDPKYVIFDARDLVHLAIEGYASKTFKSLYTFTPLYIKPPNITQPRKG